MFLWLTAAALGIAAAWFQYGRGSVAGGVGRAVLIALRAISITLLLAILLDAPVERVRPVPPWVLLDVSQSMTRGGDSLSSAAWDSASGVAAESTFVFGDSVRVGNSRTPANETATRLRDAVERSMAAGRPAVVITDGETRDSSAVDDLPRGSRVVVLARDSAAARRDAAISSLEAPRAVVEGDSLSVRVIVSAGAGGASAGAITLLLGSQQLGRWPLDAMSPWSERQADLRTRVEMGASRGGSGARALLAIVTTPGDVERRNDTLVATLELSRAASAVFVSTSPDEDARFALAILRGALALPTRGFLRVAPGMWRREGALTPATEAEVRSALRGAPIAVLHGDTAVFGPPRSAALGPLALLVPGTEAGEWYVSGTPPSPLSPALAGFPFDSLPPVTAGQEASADWVALEARRGRENVRRALVVGRDDPRRVVTVTGSGFWRWRFRGGAGADAYAALWGGIFDWLAAERADLRAAIPDENVVRAGVPVRWRRGSASDSVVSVQITPRGGAASSADTLELKFAAGSAVQESAPLPPGTYDVVVPGGRSLLVVNASAELLPARPTLRSGPVGGENAAGTSGGPGFGARQRGWLYGVVVLLLCAEWILRRRAGLR